jgi:small-conductance mechanosensitive channel
LVFKKRVGQDVGVFMAAAAAFLASPRKTAAAAMSTAFKGARRSVGARHGGVARSVARTAAHVAAGVAVLLIGHFLGAAIQRTIQHKRLALGAPPGMTWAQAAVEYEDAAASSRVRMDPTAVLLGTLAYWTTQALAVAAVFVVWGVHVASLIAALATVLFLAGMAMQGVLNDLTSGVVIAVMRVFYIGDVIEVIDAQGDRTRGVVVAFNVINTTLLDFTTRMRVTVPNRRLQDSVVVNFSRQPRRVLAIDVLASNTNADFDAIAAVMADAVRSSGDVMPLSPPDARVTSGVRNMSEVGTLMTVVFPIDASSFDAVRLSAMQLRVRQALAVAEVKLVDPF